MSESQDDKPPTSADPDSSTLSQMRRLWTDVSTVVGDSATLLKLLFIESGEHRHFALPFDRATAKRYFLSRCLQDVQRAAASRFRLIEHLQRDREREADDSNPLRAITTESLITEQGMWTRRLVEILARVVLFSTTNTDDHYLHYLVLHEANESALAERNLQADFETRSASLARRSTELFAQAQTCAIAVPIWYADSPPQRPRLPPATRILRAALEIATPAEKSALAYSYAHGFAAPSRLVHFTTTAATERPEDDVLRFYLARVMLLSIAICRRVAELAGLLDSVKLAPLPRPVERPEPPAVGDFVAVTLDRENVFLAEVVALRKQDGPLGGFCVRYLDDAPYGDIVEDEMPTELVHLVMRVRDLMNEVLAQNPPLRDLPEADLRAACRDSIRKVWELAMHSYFLRALRASE